MNTVILTHLIPLTFQFCLNSFECMYFDGTSRRLILPNHHSVAEYVCSRCWPIALPYRLPSIYPSYAVEIFVEWVSGGISLKALTASSVLFRSHWSSAFQRIDTELISLPRQLVPRIQLPSRHRRGKSGVRGQISNKQQKQECATRRVTILAFVLALATRVEKPCHLKLHLPISGTHDL